jgi:phage terminase Nu1 subunit (DNA packaging protein)
VKGVSRHALAARYGVSTKTVDRWRERGCPHLNLGRVEFDISAVESWRNGFRNVRRPRTTIER